MNTTVLEYTHTKKYCSVIKRNNLLIHTTRMNLQNRMLSEKDLPKVYATWLHLYEVLEEDKLNKDEKNQNKGERADGEGQARTFWVMLTFYNMMSLYETGPFTYQNPKFIQWLIHRVFVPFRTLANGTHVKVFGDDLCRCP